GKMIHSVKIAQEIMNALPVHEAPEFTDGYEGFYHLIDIKGSTEETEMYYIIRDFDRHAFQDKKQTLRQITEQLNEKYGKERISLIIEDQYYNMREKIEEKMEVVDIAKEAMTNLQINQSLSQFLVKQMVHSIPSWAYLHRTFSLVVKTSMGRTNLFPLKIWRNQLMSSLKYVVSSK